MNRITSFLALSAIVVAGAFAGTAAQASAANVVVDFKIHNGDGNSLSMIRSGATSSYMSGLITPASAILPGNDDPASGYAVITAPAPSVGNSVQGAVTYVNASDRVSNPCTFNIKVSHLAQASYKLEFWITQTGTNCSAPSGSVTNSDGNFSGTTYSLIWST